MRIPRMRISRGHLRRPVLILGLNRSDFVDPAAVPSMVYTSARWIDATLSSRRVGRACGAHEVILDDAVEIGYPGDAPQLAPAIQRNNDRDGRVPRVVTTDSGYGHASVELRDRRPGCSCALSPTCHAWRPRAEG